MHRWIHVHSAYSCVVMNKETARSIYKAKRKALTANDIRMSSEAIVKQVMTSEICKHAKVAHIFIPIPNKAEVDTHLLLDAFFTHHPEIKVATSIIVENDLMHTYINAHTSYKANNWNIPEPIERTLLSEKEIDVVFLPLLAFDVKGNRVGYGKGFYDRFLQKCNPNVIKVGLSLFEPTEELIESDAWDVPMNWAVTPDRVWRF
jgi:5-formyltetrahydrofolate cyclo-ligase